MKEIKVLPDGRGLRIGIAVARFNAEITEMLLAGCRAALHEADVRDCDITVAHVPGAWELPLACCALVETGRFDAVIALGAVVRGETAHFEFISTECARGLQQLGLESGVPVSFGVLTPENEAQARERADPARKNKGREVALAAVEMAVFKAQLAGVDVESEDQHGS
ncbi:MAG: 6,7-dimethyl-8-ribityllumazine synthase [Gammaproteobacteria bacterium]|nr:6,7-dimethyl-8-ribityllumazine synthase [Gammaproteobacteria bacterium]